MSKFRSALDSISGYLFLTGAISARLKSIPIFLVAAIFNLSSVFAYLIGYVLWYVAAFLYPDHPRQRDSWYGFAQFKEQYQMAALLGTMATIGTILCLISPTLIVPTAWLYALSNLIWSIGEYHKKENPPLDNEEYSSVKQALYFRYTLTVAMNSVLAAISATAIFLLPSATFIIVTTATVIGFGIAIASAYYLGKFYLGNHPPEKIPHTYQRLSNQLSFELEQSPKPDNTHKKEPRIVHSPITVTQVKLELERDSDCSCFNALTYP